VRTRPALTAFLITVVAASAFVGVRAVWASSSDVGDFVVAGDVFTRPDDVDIPVLQGPGYDGQFFFRLAIDPLDTSARAAGVMMDSPLRYQRVAYPALAHALSLGRDDLAPWSLVAVNVLALGALGAVGAAFARSSDRHALWGLLFPAYFGFVFTISRDLSEIVEVTFLLAGLLALRRDRPWLGAVLLSAAVLSRETALLAVVAIAIWRVVTLVHQRLRPSRFDVAWSIPLATFAVWQLIVLDATGVLPATAAKANRFVVPLSGLVGSLDDWYPVMNLQWVVHTLEVVTLLGLALLAVAHLRTTSAPLHERAAFVGLLVAALSVEIGEGLWSTLHDFRMFGDVYALSIVILLGSRVRLVAPSVAVGLCTFGAMATSARYL
jgi:hypothetical protein